MSSQLTILLTAILVATACGLVGPWLVLRRTSLLGDAVSHAVLPGIVVVFILFGTRAPLPITVGAVVFAVLCVLAIDAIRATGLVRSDAAIALVFPTLFALGVIGITTEASGIHFDLDSVLYGEIAFSPFVTTTVLGVEVGRAIVVMALVSALNLALIAAFWKELKATTFDPAFSRTVGLLPSLVQRAVLVCVAITAVTAFESVGAILVVTLIIVPAATAYLLTDRLAAMVAISVGVGWVAAAGGQQVAMALDASIAGAMGAVAVGCFALALLAAPRHGLLARTIARGRRRRAAAARLRSARSPVV